MNKVFLMGNLGQDPEVRYAESGTAVANISLATTDKRKDGESTTTWHRIVAFGRQAEVIGEYCTKGTKILVEGRIQVRKWEDADGNKRNTTEVVLERFHFVGSKMVEDNQGMDKPAPPKQVTPPDDDVPF